jgi:4-hydroxy-2-oxoheptanedioate aldolase
MNWFKDTFAARTHVNGIWLATGSHTAAELAAAAGFDWALLDMEHGVGDRRDVTHQIHLLTATTCLPVVRVPSPASDTIKWALDAGAAGIMAPMIETAEQARTFARALRYPPAGTRGLTRSCRACRYGHDFDAYFAEANSGAFAIVQIETAQAVEQADALAAVEGVDALFIGHADLSLNLGCFEQFDAPAIRAAEAEVLAACARHGKQAGMLLRSGMRGDALRDKGFSLLALGSDIGCLKQGFAKMLTPTDNLRKTACNT